MFLKKLYLFLKLLLYIEINFLKINEQIEME